MALDRSTGTVFAESDDDDEDDKPGDSKPPKSSSPYSGSICFKAGKAFNTSLYYVDYKQLKNNGNGLDGEEKGKLYSDLAQAKERKEFFTHSIQAARGSIERLRSEPTNVEATIQLATQEAGLELLLTEVEAARDLKCNEQTKKQLKRQIEHMVQEWCKRRRMCVEFLNSMEDYTDGTISAKQCLGGDGQIEIDSDESVIKAAIAFAKSRKNKPRTLRLTNRSDSTSLGPPPSASFVGVKLGLRNDLERVVVDEEDDF